MFKFLNDVTWLNTGWYVVSGEAKLTQRLIVSGDEMDNGGIQVQGSDT